MTARWSGVFRGERRRRCAPWRISKRNAGGFPTALGGQSPKRVFLRRVLVSETSVVEADSKHLGGASKESRKALRGAHRQATGRQKARTGPHVIHFAQGCDGSWKPKGGCEPSIVASFKPVGALVEPQQPVPRLRIESVEGARGLEPGGR
jgi:hypothetical protein